MMPRRHDRLTGVTIGDFCCPLGELLEWTGGEPMSVAFTLMHKFRHRLMFALSPSYRRIRARLDEIAPR
jgi:hypothetical protein